ncbi:complement resistance protein TraT [Marinobacter sp.]|uniref:complement resistance protein TraT n=1 Tax=Marinobacter sp. TaxID=50741 RepID=UPI0019A113CD|nr:complement resistance protein TraT [Marinobacter sp.]MBC7193377.1 hypothetical protein [Marinobacter sp.]
MMSIRVAAVLVIVMTLMAGCTSMSRQIGSLTDNKYAEPRSGTVWVVPPPQLAPPAANARTVYISYRNISDSDIDLLELLRTSAREQGWAVTNDPTNANYRLRASTRFFGEVEPESGGAFAASSMGAIAGAATGLGTGVAVANATDSGLAGAAAGIGVGGLVAAGITNASKPREWALIVDVVLEEYHSEQVEFTMATDSSSGTSDRAGTGNSRMASGGGTAKSNSSGATITKTSNYFPHGIRLSVWANQMNMKEEEALPHIEERTQRVVTQMLPM